MTERPCIIHAGTHKTGTTSLQYFLQTNSDALSRAGMHFARSGWYGVVPGNHAVAWELLRGTPGEQLRTLRTELAAVASPVVLSSEEFSLFHDQPEKIAPLLDMLRDLGFTPKILLYLRAQGEYAESIFVEQIKHGLVRDFGEVLGDIVRNGVYRLDDRTIAFDYFAMSERFAASVTAEHVLARPYGRSAPTLAIFQDFLSSLARLAPSFTPPGALELAHPRINESLTFGALLAYAFVHLNPEIGLPDDPAPFFAEHVPDIPAPWLNERFALVTRDDYRTIVESFAKSNRLVEERYAIRIPGTRAEDIVDAGAPIWERARVERATFDRCIARWRS